MKITTAHAVLLLVGPQHPIAGISPEDLSNAFVVGRQYSPWRASTLCYTLEWIDDSEGTCGVALWRSGIGTLHIQNIGDFIPDDAKQIERNRRAFAMDLLTAARQHGYRQGLTDQTAGKALLQSANSLAAFIEEGKHPTMALLQQMVSDMRKAALP